MSGGEVSGAIVGENGVFEMSGGHVYTWSLEWAVGLSVSGNAQLEVTGGQIGAQGEWGDWEGPWGDGGDVELAVWGVGNAVISGRNFNFPLFEPVQPLEGTLVGTLRDGTSIEWRFRQSETATIMLVPEPSAWLLLAMGLLPWLIDRRSRCSV